MTAANRKYNARRRTLKETIAKLKNVPCMDCGKNYPPYVMDFDHRPGEEKVAAVTQLVGKSIAVVMAEIAKCDVVCSNCHRIRTHLRRIEDVS